VGAALLWFAPAIIAKTSLKNRFVRDALADMNGNATIGSASLSWFGPIELHDVKLFDAKANPAISAKKITSSRTLYDLAMNRDDLGTITIDEPRIEIRVGDRTSNIETMFQKYIEADATPKKPERTAMNIQVNNGTVLLTDVAAKQTQTISASNINVAVPRARAEAMKVNIVAGTTEAGREGKVTAACQFVNGGDVKVIADQFAIGHLQALLHRFLPDANVNGTLSGDFKMTWGRDPKERIKLTVDGWAAAQKVHVANAKWFGPDQLLLQELRAGGEARPIKVSFIEGVISSENADLACDVGTASISGKFDPTIDPEKLLELAGLHFKANLDVAKLGTLLPHTFRIKEGTQFRRGTIQLDISSVAGAPGQGPTWRGMIDTTPLEAIRDGKAIVWNEPIKLTFLGKLERGGRPNFDDFTLQSDFIGMRARGKINDFHTRAVIDLNRLAAHLADFTDLGGTKLEGTADINLLTTPNAQGGFTLKAVGNLNNFVLVDAQNIGIREQQLKVVADGIATLSDKGIVGFNTLDAKMISGTDSLAIVLKEPIPDVRQMNQGKAGATLAGDMDRWRKRIGPMVGFPARWDLLGTGTISADVVLASDAIDARDLDIDIRNAIFNGAGIALNESELIARGTMRFDRTKKSVTFTNATLSSRTIGARTERMDIAPGINGEYGVSFNELKAEADIARLQRLLKLTPAADGSDALAGIARATVKLDMSRPNIVAFNTQNLVLMNFVLGPTRNPTWTDPYLNLKLDGNYDMKNETLAFQSASLQRDGLSATARGQLADLTGDVNLNLDGTVTYDLAKLDSQLKRYLGKSAEIVGKDTKPFRIAGNLSEGGKNLNVAVGGTPSGTNLTNLRGNAAVAWQSLKAYGFDVGAAEMKATIDRGVVALSPLEAAFGGGTVRVQPTISLNPGAYDLSFARGKIIDHAKLTPNVLSEALGYALPAIANAAQADGVISFELDENRIPLANPEQGMMRGKLTLHSATVSPGPVITQILQTIGVKNTSMKLVENEVVPIEFVDGRVTHKNFSIRIDTVTIRSSGSVGLDGRMNLQIEVPLNEQIIGTLGVLKDRPRIREALAKQTVMIPVGGTLNRPQLNPQAFQTAVARIVDGAVRDATRGAVDDVIKGGVDKLPFKFPFFPK